jgi:hypothetical protein
MPEFGRHQILMYSFRCSHRRADAAMPNTTCCSVVAVVDTVIEAGAGGVLAVGTVTVAGAGGVLAVGTVTVVGGSGGGLAVNTVTGAGGGGVVAANVVTVAGGGGVDEVWLWVVTWEKEAVAVMRP